MLARTLEVEEARKKISTTETTSFKPVIGLVGEK